MIGSEVEVYNLALNAVGARNNVSSPSENSREAEVCKLWYPVIRDQVLSAGPWPEATRFSRLTLAAEADDSWDVGEPRPGYSFTYLVPTDLLHPQYISGFERFQLSAGPNNTKILSSSVEDPILAYTFRQEVITLWSSQLQLAVVYGLAAHICMPLAGKPTRAKLMLQQANDIILSAREAAANTSDDRYEAIPDWLAARGFTAATSSSYYHPFGSLLVLGNV